MKNDFITRISSVMLALLFLSNDLVASVRTIINPPIFSTVVELPLQQSASIGGNINDVQSQRHAQTNEISSSIFVLENAHFNADHKVAYLGSHPLDQMHSPTDDLFKIVINQPVDNFEQAILSYKVKGLVHGEKLPKTINGYYSYGAKKLLSDNQWQSVEMRIDATNLKNGTNTIQFSAPQNAGAIEIKDVEINLLINSTEENDVPNHKISAEALFFTAASEADPTPHAFALSEEEMASIPRSIQNVTMGASGYQVFSNLADVVSITMAVDKQKLLGTGNLRDVVIYYFDVEMGNWRPVTPKHVDMSTMVLETDVPSNSDYFAGMIKTPEMPEAAAYMPTAISDIEAANPAAGMNIMNPPDVSHTGEASLSYPLDIPQGRNGMTPSLALSYNSDGGTGMMGVGWNMSMMSVSVDTRWGVPTFRTDKESEVYTLNGTPLVMEGGKMANREKVVGGQIQPNGRKGEAYFFERTMSGYKKIKRKGTGTSTYYWVETQANQTKYYYGTTDGATINNNYVLKNGNDIVKWYLAKIEDKWGNTINYYYHKNTNTTTQDVKNGGVTVLLDSIRYTGHGSNIGKYAVKFHTSHGRPDATYSFKSGVKELDDAWLDSVDVSYGNNLIKRFTFVYNEGNFFKQRLDAIKEYRNNQFFYEHTFDYYDGDLSYSSNAEIIKVNHNNTNVYGSMPSEISKLASSLVQGISNSPIKTTATDGWSAGGSLGVGVTATFLAFLPEKSFTAQGSMSYSESHTHDQISLSDVNGDGLPDVVYDKKINGRSFFPMSRGIDNKLSLLPRKPIQFGGRLLESRSSSFSYGFNFSLPVNSYFFGMNWNDGSSVTSTYLTDYNADGIMDLVAPAANGRSAVLFGHLNSKDELGFTSTSEYTYNPIFKDAVLDEPSDNETVKDFEIVRSWEAPFDGTIVITGNASVLSGLTGVAQIGIQKNSSLFYGFQTVTPSQSVNVNQSIAVNKGDLILFRAHAENNGQQDLLVWNPQVEYQLQPILEPNNLNYFNSNYEDGFLLSAGSGSSFSGDDAFRVELNDNITGHLTDTVVLRMNFYAYDSNGDEILSEIWEKTIPAGSNGSGINFYLKGTTTAANFTGSTYQNVQGISGEDECHLTFEAFSVSNVDWKAIEWRPEVQFNDPCSQVPRIDYPTVLYRTFNRLERLEYPNDLNTLPALEVPLRHRVFPVFSYNSNDFDEIYNSNEISAQGGFYLPAYLVVKNNRMPIYKMAILFENDRTLHMKPVAANGDVNMAASTLPYFYGFDFEDPDMYVEIFAENPKVAEFIQNHLVEMKLEYIDQGGMQINLEYWNVFCHDYNELQDQMLHWGQFAWSNVNGISPIDTASLHMASTEFAQENMRDGEVEPNEIATQMQNNENELNPMNQEFFMLLAKHGEYRNSLRSYIETHGEMLSSPLTQNQSLDRWSVMGSYMGAYPSFGSVVPGLLGEPEPVVVQGTPVTPNMYGAYAISQRSKSKSLATSTGTAFISTSQTINDPSTYYTQSTSGFQDINGDGYPDALLYGANFKAYVTSPTGGHINSLETIHAGKFNKSTSSSSGAVVSGEFINSDPRFSRSTGGNLGDNYTKIEFIDINGDGLPERVNTNGNVQANLNNGKSLEPSVTLNNSNIQNSYSVTESFNLGSNLSVLKNLKSKNSFSFSAGVNINHVGSESKYMFRDVNGDGLTDWLSISSSGTATLYLNTGTSFQLYGGALSYDKGANKANAYGFSGSLAGTYSFSPTPTPFVALKFSLNGNGQANFSMNEISSSLVDMNGDGWADYVTTTSGGNLSVRYCEGSKSNKLKTVTNPLKGSFTIHYDLQGNKRGKHKTQVKTHMTDDKELMVWDMPEGKWVMSKLEVFDGLDVTNGSTDVDGSDTTYVFFAYDGGIKSRREREFMGFTRTEKRYLPTQGNFPDLPIDGLEKYFIGDSIEYITEVTEYEKPNSNNPQHFVKFDYVKNLVANQLTLYNKIVKTTTLIPDPSPHGDLMPYFTFKHTIKPITVQTSDYEFRYVSIDNPTDPDFNRVANAGSVWEPVTWNNATSTECIFPAMVATSTYTFPQVRDANVDDKFYAMRYNITYDEYFNVTMYRNEGTLTNPDIDTAIVDTIFHTYYDYIVQGNPFQTLTGYNDSLSDDVQDVYVVACNDSLYGNDTVAIGIQTNLCLGQTLGDLDTIWSEHSRLIIDTVYMKEMIDNSTYNGAVIAQMEYFTPANASGQTNVLKRHKVFVGSTAPANLKRHTLVNSLQSNLSPAEIYNYLTDTEYAETDIVYNTYGNVTQITAPENHKPSPQRLQTFFGYDTDVNQFVTSISNSYGDAICNSYDIATGNLKRTVDINGHPTQYVYDNNYRVAEIWAPRELSNINSAPTLTFDYFPEGIGGSSVYDDVPVAITTHNMARNPMSENYTGTTVNCENWINLAERPDIADSMRTATFIDGSKKVVQIKKDASQDSSTVQMVSGMTKIDHLARDYNTTINQVTTGNPIGRLNNVPSSTLAVENLWYDYVNRSEWTRSVAESGYLNTYNNFSWEDLNGTDVYYEEVNIPFSQATGSHVKTYKDSWGRAYRTTAYGANQQEITTEFEYNPLGELLKSINPLLVETDYTYDNFGRMTQETHKDRGITVMEYDMAGNVHKIRNAATGLDTAIVMYYDYNRLERKEMPTTEGLYGVEYTYGALNDGNNGAGRIITVEQGGTFKTDNYKYDELGNMVYEYKSMALPNTTKTFTTEYSYDSWGRVLDITYPDNEYVKYMYKTTGELEQIKSVLSGETSFVDIISQIYYDGFDNMSYMEYGNGAITTYSYFNKTKRLENVRLNTLVDQNTSARGYILNKDYTYDPMGRVTQVENTPVINTQHMTMGGSYTFNYTYDSFNRLKTTTATADFETSEIQGNSTYSLTMGYNKAGGILSKTQTAYNANDIGYNLDYTYDADAPSPVNDNEHQLYQIENTGSTATMPYKTGFAYSKAGSIRAIATQATSTANMDTVERFVRNEEQWLMGYENTDKNEIVHFVYDHTGERILKGELTSASIATNGQSAPLSLSMSAYTMYVNPYYVIEHYNNADKLSKHYYMGMQRVATNLGTAFTPSEEMNKQGSIDQNAAPLLDNLKQVLADFGKQEGTDYVVSDLQETPAIEDYYDMPEEGTANKTTEGGGEPIGEYPSERLMYYYHPDYLGNVEYITDMDGLPYQYFSYTPWGEEFKSDIVYPNSWDSPYRFNGKEIDEETGLYYYGARYYNPSISVWLSVDPLADKYPNSSPYVFTSNNPIMLIDPSGMGSENPNDGGWTEPVITSNTASRTYDPETRTTTYSTTKRSLSELKKTNSDGSTTTSASLLKTETSSVTINSDGDVVDTHNSTSYMGWDANGILNFGESGNSENNDFNKVTDFIKLQIEREKESVQSTGMVITEYLADYGKRLRQNDNDALPFLVLPNLVSPGNALTSAFGIVNDFLGATPATAMGPSPNPVDHNWYSVDISKK